MDPIYTLLGGVLIAVACLLAAALVILWQRLKTATQEKPEAEELNPFAELGGRLQQLAETTNTMQTNLSTQLQNQERELSRKLEERLADVSRRVGDSLTSNVQHTQKEMSSLRERLAVIDTAQKNITELSTQMVGLQDILSNKQRRGIFGEIQLQDLVQTILPPSAYAFQAKLSNDRRADCLLTLPNPPGAIAIDAKFPLESFEAMTTAETKEAQTAAGRQFSRDVVKHLEDIAGRYIIPGETADSACMFLPSETVYAELYSNFPEVIEKSFRLKVWIVSPTTLMATLNTVRAILKDARMREQAHVIQREVLKIADDVGRLDERVGKLQKHFDQSSRDIEDIRISTNKIVGHTDRIERIQLEEDREGDSANENIPLAGERPTVAKISKITGEGN